MILIGWATQSRMDRQWQLLSRLSGHFLDVVAGLPTLKVFGRAKAQAASIRAITSDYRRATLRTLRIAFLSSFALELLATLSVALVAVTIGMRLVHGELDLYTGLVVLILAPEAYLPIRQVGAQYRGSGASRRPGDLHGPGDRTPGPGRWTFPESLRLGAGGCDRTLRGPRRTVAEHRLASPPWGRGDRALVGPSGVGKSTLLNVVLNCAVPDEAMSGSATSRAGAQRGQLMLALLLGSLAVGSAVGLMAVSGWLISRASEEPPVMYLMMAVTATRAFGIGRAVFRYAERLVSHDAVLKLLADLRVSVYRGLERIAPAGLRTTRRGDLLTRLVADVDALQDYWLRWLLPAGTAVVVGTAAAGFTGWLLPEAGVILAVGLLLAGVGVPLVWRRLRPPYGASARAGPRRPRHPRRRPARRHRGTGRRRGAARAAEAAGRGRRAAHPDCLAHRRRDRAGRGPPPWSAASPWWPPGSSPCPP
ncbi:hypothetical protein SCALM49S_04736 [Streptomyces californicus]